MHPFLNVSFPNEILYPSFGCMVSWSHRSFVISLMGGKLQFHAPIGALANSYDNYADIYFRNKQVNKNVLEDMTTFQLK